MQYNKKFKTGVTSIYIVIFSTLLLSVIVVSFISLILSEYSRTVDAKLAQSAYDSALAGVEDAKLALIAYRNCTMNADNTIGWQSSVNCSDVKKYMNDINYKDKCGMTAWILNRLPAPDVSEINDWTGEVMIQETDSSIASETTQAYTCVTIEQQLPDYRSYLTTESPVRIVPLLTSTIKDLTGIRVRWYSDSYGSEYVYTNVSSSGKASFQSIDASNGAATPPTLSIQLVQGDEYFALSDFDESNNGKTNRGAVFLVPSNNHNAQIDFTQDGKKIISAQNGFVNSNNKSTRNESFTIYCQHNLAAEFACATSISLPQTINSNRNDDVSFLVVSLPYDQPNTDFSIELCTDTDSVRGDCVDASNNPSIAKFEGAQALVDSTGRANDLYSRVDARVELVDIYFPYPDFALQVNSNSDEAILKNFWTTTDDCWYSDSLGRKIRCNSAGSL